LAHALVLVGAGGADAVLDQLHWPIDADDGEVAHEVGHWLGLPDRGVRRRLLFNQPPGTLWVRAPAAAARNRAVGLDRGKAFQQAMRVLDDAALNPEQRRQALQELGFTQRTRRNRVRTGK